MNPTRVPGLLQSSHIYHHPLISSESFVMTQHLDKINGVANVSFAGAWMGFEFHEDGFAAGVHAARTLMDGREKKGPLRLMDDGKESHLDTIGFTRVLLRLAVVLVLQLLRLRRNLVAWIS